jgi:nicotinamide-nucleotide amidase
MFDERLCALSAAVLAAARSRHLRLATAESCTGGLVAGVLTEIAGSSDVFDRGFVTYSNGSKADLLGVSSALIAAHGAVSEPVARAMAEGALARSSADIAVAITGIAGPGGGSPAKPVGLVHFAVAGRGFATLHLEKRFGEEGRTAIRLAAVHEALTLVLAGLAQSGQAARLA